MNGSCVFLWNMGRLHRFLIFCKGEMIPSKISWGRNDVFQPQEFLKQEKGFQDLDFQLTMTADLFRSMSIFYAFTCASNLLLCKHDLPFSIFATGH